MVTPIDQNKENPKRETNDPKIGVSSAGAPTELCKIHLKCRVLKRHGIDVRNANTLDFEFLKICLYICTTHLVLKGNNFKKIEIY